MASIVQMTASGTFSFSGSAVVTDGEDSVRFGEKHRMSRFGNLRFGQTKHRKVSNSDIRIFNQGSAQQSPTWSRGSAQQNPTWSKVN